MSDEEEWPSDEVWLSQALAWLGSSGYSSNSSSSNNKEGMLEQWRSTKPLRVAALHGPKALVRRQILHPAWYPLSDPGPIPKLFTRRSTSNRGHLFSIALLCAWLQCERAESNPRLRFLAWMWEKIFEVWPCVAKFSGFIFFLNWVNLVDEMMV